MSGYPCQECHKGIVKDEVCKNFETKFARVPFVVPEAVIGVCDQCGAQHFDGQEYERWERLFEEDQVRKKALLGPEDIRGLHESLGLTMSDFAMLLGTTRQSVHYWEKDDRDVAQSRMADLMMKLVRESLRKKNVNVVEFLYKTARELGIDMKAPAPPREKEKARSSGRKTQKTAA